MSEKYKILLVEDSALPLKIGQKLLQQLNCQVDIASTGQQAIDRLEKNHYDLVFMDLGLPDIDGISVTEIFREKQPSKDSQTPIVAVTAHQEPEYKANAFAAGMNDFIVKPLTKDLAVKILEKYCPKQ